MKPSIKAVTVIALIIFASAALTTSLTASAESSNRVAAKIEKQLQNKLSKRFNKNDFAVQVTKQKKPQHYQVSFTSLKPLTSDYQNRLKPWIRAQVAKINPSVRETTVVMAHTKAQRSTLKSARSVISSMLNYKLLLLSIIAFSLALVVTFLPKLGVVKFIKQLRARGKMKMRMKKKMKNISCENDKQELSQNILRMIRQKNNGYNAKELAKTIAAKDASASKVDMEEFRQIKTQNEVLRRQIGKAQFEANSAHKSAEVARDEQLNIELKMQMVEKENRRINGEINGLSALWSETLTKNNLLEKENQNLKLELSQLGSHLDNRTQALRKVKGRIRTMMESNNFLSDPQLAGIDQKTMNKLIQSHKRQNAVNTAHKLGRKDDLLGILDDMYGSAKPEKTAS